MQRTEHDETSRRHEFGILATPLRGYLFASALRLTCNPDLAEDVVQETLIRGFNFFHYFQRGTNFKGWILRILRNVCVNYWRSRANELKAMKAMRDQALVGFEIAGHVESPDETLECRSLSPQVLAELERVPETQREAVLLVDVLELTGAEAAQRMGCAEGTIMSRVFRGRQLLRRRLCEYALEQRYITAETARRHQQALLAA